MPKRLTPEEHRVRAAERRKKETEKAARALQREAKREARAARKAEREEKKRLKAEREKRGVNIVALAWPPDVARKEHTARETWKHRTKEVQDIIASIAKTAVQMELDYCSIGWGVHKYAMDMTSDPTFGEPGITIFYGRTKGEVWHRRILMDDFTTVTANLHVAAQGLAAMHKLIKARFLPWISCLDQAMLAVVPLATKASLPLRDLDDAFAILELQQRRDITLADLKQHYEAMAITYHPSRCGGNDGPLQKISQACRMVIKDIKSKQLPRKSKMPLVTVVDAQRVLELDELKDKKQVEAQYKTLLIKFHPDKAGGDEEDAKALGHARDMLEKHLKEKAEVKAKTKSQSQAVEDKVQDASRRAQERAKAKAAKAHAPVSAAKKATPPRIVRRKKDTIDRETEQMLKS